MTAVLTVAQVAAHVGGSVEGDSDRPVSGLATLEDAGPGDLTFVVDRERARGLDDSAAAAVLIPMDLSVSAPRVSLVRVENPRLALAMIAPLLVPEETPEPEVASSAHVHPEALLGERVYIGPCAVIGARAVIGDEAHIGALTLVEAGATIGRSCRIGPSCTIGGSVRMGDRVRMLPGARVGTEGFGFTPGPSGLVKTPQMGGCLIGANTTVDRGALGDTVIGSGTKIDNLVQIAHNVRIGRNCAIAGQVGLAGSVQLGDGVQLGGQVGIADHVRVGDGARVGAQSGVMRDIPAGATHFGYPAMPQRDAMRAMSGLHRVHELLKRLKRLEAAVFGRGE